MVAKTEEVKAEILELKEKIRKHNYHYFVEDDPQISDRKYDQLMQRLIELEEEYPEFKTDDSPTQRVGGEPIDEFEKVEHDIPLLSLDKSFSAEELKDFDRRIKNRWFISVFNLSRW